MTYYTSRGAYFFLLIVLSLSLAIFLPDAPNLDKILLIISPGSEGSKAFTVGVNYGVFLVIAFILGDFLFQRTRIEPILNDDTIVNVGTLVPPLATFLITLGLNKDLGFALESLGGAVVGWAGTYILGIAVIFVIAFPIIQLMNRAGSTK